MRVSFIGHASILVEEGDVSVLSDPWWRGPCFGAQWWNKPEPATELLADRPPPDYIYVSHGHHDHLHPGTLKTLDRRSKVLVSREIDIADSIRALGFEVMELDPNQSYPLSENLTAWLWPTYSDDTLLVLKGAHETCINLNDALHSAPRDIQDQFIEKLNKLFPNPDYVFCGYGIASHFPNCYRIPGKDDAATAVQRQSYFNGQWAHIMHGLQPKYGFPFAANLVFFEDDLARLNEPVHNGERPVDKYRALYGAPSGQLIDIAPGFQIEGGTVLTDRQTTRLDYDKLAADNTACVTRANTYFPPSEKQLEEITALLQKNIQIWMPYLTEYPGDYSFEIPLRGSDDGFVITKRGREITPRRFAKGDRPQSPDIRFYTRAGYLRRSLAEPYGSEILFVGSGGVFDYRAKALADENLHTELQTIVRYHKNCPKSRYGDNPLWLYKAKTAVKGLLGRTPSNLYDLQRWVVYE
jgi:hypothetical protein